MPKYCYLIKLRTIIIKYIILILLRKCSLIVDTTINIIVFFFFLVKHLAIEALASFYWFLIII